MGLCFFFSGRQDPWRLFLLAQAEELLKFCPWYLYWKKGPAML